MRPGSSWWSHLDSTAADAVGRTERPISESILKHAFKEHSCRLLASQFKALCGLKVGRKLLQVYKRLLTAGADFQFCLRASWLCLLKSSPDASGEFRSSAGLDQAAFAKGS